MALPLGLALAKSRSRVWWAPTLVILIGVMATASRTPILGDRRRRRRVRCGFARVTSVPLLPLADPDGDRHQDRRAGIDRHREESLLPAAGREPHRVAAHARGRSDAHQRARQPRAENQRRHAQAAPRAGSGHQADRRSDNPLRNAPILDNQWLGLFLDVGLLGLCRMGLADRPDRSPARSCRANEGKPGRLACGRFRRIHHRLRRRDDHLRLARVRPGDVRLLDDPGARCDAGRSSSGDRALPQARVRRSDVDAVR